MSRIPFILTCLLASGTIGCQVTRMDHPSAQTAHSVRPAATTSSIATDERSDHERLEPIPAARLPVIAASHSDESPSLVVPPPPPDILPSPSPTGHATLDTTPASEEGAMSLSDLQELALANSPILSHAAARLRRASATELQASLYPNPVIGYRGMEIGNRGTAGQQSGFVRQRIVMGGKLELDQAVARGAYDTEQAMLEASRLRVLTDVRNRYFTVLISERRLELSGRLVTIADDLLDATRKLKESDRATENTLLQAEIEAAKAAIRRDNAANEYDEAWTQLAAVVGVPDLPRGALSGSIDDIMNTSTEPRVDSLLATHPLLDAAHARVCQAQARIARAEAEPIPDLDVLGGVGRIPGTNSNAATAQLGIEIPLYDDNEGNILAAEADLAAARAETERVELKLRSEFATALRQLSNARQQADRYSDQILPKAERSLNLVQTGYAQGQVEFLTLVNAQQTFVEVNLAWVDSLDQLQSAQAILEGRLLSNSLAAD